MAGILISINMVFLIAYIIYTQNNKIKYGKLVLNNKKKLFNIILFIIFITYVILQTYFIYKSQPTTINIEELRADNTRLKTSGDRLFEALMWLILSPIVWITLFHFYKKFTENFLKKKYIKSNKNIQYYRGTFQNVSPGIVSFILESNINISKSVVADILKLKLEGYITEKQNKLKVSNLDATNLSKSDQLLLNTIKTNQFSQEEYEKAIEDEALELKLLSHFDNNFDKAIKISINTIPRIIIFILLICALFITNKIDEKLIEDVFIFTNSDFNTTDNKDDYFKERYIKVDEEVFNKLKEKREEEITKLAEKELENEKKNNSTENESNNTSLTIPSFNINSQLELSLKKSKYRMQDLINQVYFTNILGDHYVRADRVYVGIISLDMLIKLLNIIFILLLLLCVVSVGTIINFIIVSAKYSNMYILTNKGMKLRKEILGLKKYLKDYSLIKKRTREEVIIWEYYLIYAVVIHENFKIEDEIIKGFVNQLYDNI